jgi:putative sigma-54 modulation protein
MNTPLEIQFNGLEKSEAVEAHIAEKVAWLEKHFDRMTHCRVVLELPHRHEHKSKIYQVKIEVGVPGHAPVIVSHEGPENHAHEDVQIAIRDAFNAARRRVDDVAARLSAPAKLERGRRRPAPEA